MALLPKALAHPHLWPLVIVTYSDFMHWMLVLSIHSAAVLVSLFYILACLHTMPVLLLHYTRYLCAFIQFILAVLLWGILRILMVVCTIFFMKHPVH